MHLETDKLPMKSHIIGVMWQILSLSLYRFIVYEFVTSTLYTTPFPKLPRGTHLWLTIAFGIHWSFHMLFKGSPL